MTGLFIASLLALAYIYGGYPLFLRLLVRIRGPRRVLLADTTPTMTLVISAYNEAAVMRAKLDNALALDYPRDRLEIVVISDASTDDTDRVVTEYASRGVTLHRQRRRSGKVAGLNRILPLLTSELVAFSDANAMYEPDALRKLARNFADKEVGCVTGEARYIPGGRAMADVAERVYWNYEMQLKRLETQVGSMVGGDGAIYAIRRSLWRQLPEDAINDLLNPLQIVAAGWRAVYEPEAVCYEETAGGIRAEYRRRVRIVSRSWRAVFQARQVLNPFRVGLFSWCLISHKILRWLSGLFLALVVVGATASFVRVVADWPLVASGLLPMIAAAACLLTQTGRRVAGMVAYFAVISAASVEGLVRGTLGRVSGVWIPPRASPSVGRAHSSTVSAVRLLQAIAALGAASVMTVCWLAPPHSVAAFVFWSSTALLAYVYAGYPALLTGLRLFADRPVRRASIEPTVCLFITANDEAHVIEAKLRNALALDYPRERLDIIVASDGSIDDTNAIVRRFGPRVSLLELSPRRGKIAAINTGMSAVTSDIVVFSDANTFLEPGAVRALVRNFADERIGVVTAGVTPRGYRAALAQSEDLYYRYERWIQKAESDIGSTIGVDGALYAIRRELFVPPPNDTILDNLAIPMAVIRAGCRVVFESAARAHEQGSETAKEEFGRKSRLVAGAMQFLRRAESAVPLESSQVILSLLSHKVLRWLSPVFAVCALISSAILAADAWRGFAFALATQTTLLGLGLAGCVLRLRRFRVVSVAHYFCLVHAAALVGFVRGIAGRQSVLWRRSQRGRPSLDYVV